MKRAHLTTRRLAAVLLLACTTLARPAEPPAGKLPPGVERLPNGDLRMGNLLLHREAREISFPAVFVPNVSVLEVIIATPDGRLHEALLKAEIEPVQFQAMLYLLGLNNGPRVPDSTGRQGGLADIDIEWQDAGGTTRREPVESWIIDTRTEKPMERIGWVFTGSPIRDGVFLASEGGNVVINYSAGATVLDSPDPASTEDTIHVNNTAKERPGDTAKVRVFVVPRTNRP